MTEKHLIGKDENIRNVYRSEGLTGTMLNEKANTNRP